MLLEDIDTDKLFKFLERIKWNLPDRTKFNPHTENFKLYHETYNYALEYFGPLLELSIGIEICSLHLVIVINEYTYIEFNRSSSKVENMVSYLENYREKLEKIRHEKTMSILQKVINRN